MLLSFYCRDSRTWPQFLLTNRHPPSADFTVYATRHHVRAVPGRAASDLRVVISRPTWGARNGICNGSRLPEDGDALLDFRTRIVVATHAQCNVAQQAASHNAVAGFRGMAKRFPIYGRFSEVLSIAMVVKSEHESHSTSCVVTEPVGIRQGLPYRGRIVGTRRLLLDLPMPETIWPH